MANAQTKAGETPGQSANGGGTQPDASGQQPGKEVSGETPKSFNEWLASQDESTQEMLEGHVAGLKATAQTEREERKKLDKRLKEISKTLEDGSAAKGELEKLRGDFSEQNARASFYEDAHQKGVSNLKLAYLTAKSEDLIDEKGRVDFDALKKSFPELFPATKSAIPPGNAGAGVGAALNKLSGPASINAAIRRAAGIR